MIGSSGLKQGPVLSALRPAVQKRAESYQNNRADWVWGQDVILQGSAVTLRFHVGSTLVMELEEVEAIINNLKLAATEINISAIFFRVYLQMRTSLSRSYFLLSYSCKQVFSECKLAKSVVRYQRCQNESLNNKKQWEYNEEVAASRQGGGLPWFDTKHSGAQSGPGNT